MKTNDYIVVFGGCSLDMSYYEKSDGTYPKKANLYVPGGKGANQAVATARAGQNVKIISRLGDDKIGELIIKNLKNNGIDTSLIELDKNVKNDISKIYINKNGDNDIQREVGAIDSFYVGMIKKYASIIKNAKFVIAQMKIPKEVSVELINFCYKNNVPIVITPCRPDKLSIKDTNNKNLIEKISFITCNEEEAKIVFDCDDVNKIVKKYPNKLIVTLGEKGLIYNDGTKNIIIKTIPVNVKDTTGAGDTLCGNFVSGIVSGMSIHKSLERATVSSALKIQQETAQKGMPTKTELDKYLDNLSQNKQLN